MKRVFGLLLVLTAAVPALAGCGTEDLSPSSIAQAADTTVAKNAMKIRIDQTITMPGAGALVMTGSGEIDTRSQMSHITMRVADGPSAAAGAPVGDLSSTEVISDKLVVYMRVAQLEGVLGEGKRWMRVDAAKAAEAAGLDTSALLQSGQDPAQAISQLGAVSGDVEKVGEEKVRGVDTTHYRATVDFDRYPSLVPASQRAAVRASMRRLEKLMGSSTAPVDVWVDDDDLVRRYRQ